MIWICYLHETYSTRHIMKLSLLTSQPGAILTAIRVDIIVMGSVES